MGGAKKRKPVESKLDKRLQVSMACGWHAAGMACCCDDDL